MPRNSFGKGISDWGVERFDLGEDDAWSAIAPGATVTVWDDETGGDQIEDLLDADENPITELVVDEDGRIPFFWGPEEGILPTIPPEYVGSTTAEDFSDSLTLDVPEGTEEGDLMLVVGSANDFPDVTPPGGWTELFNEQFGTQQVHMYGWYRFAGSSEPDDYTWTWDGDHHHRLVAHTFRGVEEISDWGININNSTVSIDAVPLSAASNNMLFIGGFHWAETPKQLNGDGLTVTQNQTRGYITAYNLRDISGATTGYSVSSTLSVPGFMGITSILMRGLATGVPQPAPDTLWLQVEDGPRAAISTNSFDTSLFDDVQDIAEQIEGEDLASLPDQYNSLANSVTVLEQSANALSNTVTQLGTQVNNLVNEDPRLSQAVLYTTQASAQTIPPSTEVPITWGASFLNLIDAELPGDQINLSIPGKYVFSYAIRTSAISATNTRAFARLDSENVPSSRSQERGTGTVQKTLTSGEVFVESDGSAMLEIVFVHNAAGDMMTTVGTRLFLKYLGE